MNWASPRTAPSFIRQSLAIPMPAESKVPTASDTRASMMFGPGQLTGQGIPIAKMADVLSQLLHRTVVDKTGLMGKYDITLKWTPEEGLGPAVPGPGGAPQRAESAPPPDSGPSIFTAIQEQLGLKLESTKGPVETLVIDHVETPSEN